MSLNKKIMKVLCKVFDKGEDEFFWEKKKPKKIFFRMKNTLQFNKKKQLEKVKRKYFQRTPSLKCFWQNMPRNFVKNWTGKEFCERFLRKKNRKN